MFDQLAIDRITEIENLTDNLDDDDANWLIDWGVAQAKAQLANEKNEDSAQEKIGAVIAVMRQLNKLVGDREGAIGDVTARLKSLIEAYNTAFAQTQLNTEPSADLLSTQATAIAKLAPRDLMQQCLDFLNPSQPPLLSERAASTPTNEEPVHGDRAGGIVGGIASALSGIHSHENLDDSDDSNGSNDHPHHTHGA
jgi:hypothetical protein